MILQTSISSLLAGEAIESLALHVDNGVIYNEDIRKRLYICFLGQSVIITDNIAEIKKETGLTVSKNAKEFYQRYGFINPPFTLYDNVYLLAPYIGIFLSDTFKCVTRYPKVIRLEGSTTELQRKIQNDIKDNLRKEKGKFQVLFSGGLDSSLLLGIAHELGMTTTAVNCFMSSMPEESIRAQKMCESKNIPFRVVRVNDDLTVVARKFIDYTAEPIADKIALVIPAIFTEQEEERKETILDGQGADSLLSGLPHDRLYDFYTKKGYHLLGQCLGWFPVWKNKKNPLGRCLYRITKSLNCLGAANPVAMIIRSLVENETELLSPDNHVQKWLNKELNSLYNHLGDFHLVIRYFFMFRMLPAREMQKYTLAESFGYRFNLPFLEKNFVTKYFYLLPSNSIKSGVYKYPIVTAAKKYWPEFFRDSRTSPFQVDFKTSGETITEFSLEYISRNYSMITQG